MAALYLDKRQSDVIAAAVLKIILSMTVVENQAEMNWCNTTLWLVSLVVCSYQQNSGNHLRLALRKARPPPPPGKGLCKIIHQ